MLIVYGDNKKLYQWDTGRRLIVSDPECYQVHFGENLTDEASVLEVYEYEGQRVVDIPNFLLQRAVPFVAFTFVIGEDSKMTTEDQWFKVIARNKPADYIYTETDVLSYGKLAKDLAVLRESLPAIGPASVGQFLRVKAVNENGVPTALEAVTMAVENWEFGLDDGSTVTREVYVKA
jgi:hypothetical protein